MSNHLRGSKRLKVIQDYLNGKEDDNWEVYPSRTEGKYIVRPRKEPLKPTPVPKEQPIKEEPPKEIINEPIEEPKPVSKPKPYQPSAPFYDPTINIEILNQLKLLGEEIKQKREKKEQKRMIKEVVNKQMMKQPRYQYTQPQYIQEPNVIEDDEPNNEINEEPQPIAPPIYRRRNNIFSDMF